MNNQLESPSDPNHSSWSWLPSAASLLFCEWWLYKTLNQGLLFLPGQCFYGALTLHGRCAVGLWLDIDQLHRPTRSSVASAAALIVHLEAALGIHCPTGVESTILTLDNVAKARLLASRSRTRRSRLSRRLGFRGL